MAIIVEGLKEQIEQLDQLLASNPDMEKRMQTVIRKVLGKAQRQMQKDVAGSMPNDPRHAAKAVRKAVYKRILGGNINILRKGKASGKTSSYEPQRTLRAGQRGGNRMLRSARTKQLMGYEGSDRGFILRFLNNGTNTRSIKSFNTDPHRSQVMRGSQGGNLNKYGKTVNTGGRGRIVARNVFASHLVSIGDYIDTLLAQEFSDLVSKVANGGSQSNP